MSAKRRESPRRAPSAAKTSAETLISRPDDTLIVTREHDAKDPDEMAARVLRAIEQGEGTATDGSHFPTRCDSICIHSDTPNALDIARVVRAAIAPYSEKRT